MDPTTKLISDIYFNFFQDYAKLFPVFHYGREYLHQVTGEPMMIRHESGKKSGSRSFESGNVNNVEADAGGSTVTDEYETEEVEMGKLISAKSRTSSSEQTYR